MSDCRAVVLAVALLAASPVVSIAHGVKTRTIEIVHPWTQPTAPGEPATVCMKIKNLAGRADKLKAASTPFASAVELHLPVAGGASGESNVVPAFDIKGKGQLEMSKTGARLVLKGVSKQLSPYDMIPMTLVFERAGKIEIEVMVED